VQAWSLVVSAPFLGPSSYYYSRQWPSFQLVSPSLSFLLHLILIGPVQFVWCLFAYGWTFLWVFVYNAETEGLVRTLSRCCTVGVRWSWSNQNCSAYLAPVRAVSPEHQAPCLSTIEACCEKTYRSLNGTLYGDGHLLLLLKGSQVTHLVHEKYKISTELHVPCPDFTLFFPMCKPKCGISALSFKCSATLDCNALKILFPQNLFKDIFVCL